MQYLNKLLKTKGFGVRVGGNWNNGLHVGSRYVNLNNLASNTNTNIGSRISYVKLIMHIKILAAWRK